MGSENPLLASAIMFVVDEKTPDIEVRRVANI